jgi:hypothetical protein
MLCWARDSICAVFGWDVLHLHGLPAPLAYQI